MQIINRGVEDDEVMKYVGDISICNMLLFQEKMYGGIFKFKFDNGFENGKKKLCEFLNQDLFDMIQV